MRHGRLSRPTLLNLGVRRPLGAEPEVDKPYTQTASDMSNSCLLTSKFDQSEAAFVIVTSPAVLSKIGRLRRPCHISFPNYDAPPS